MTAPSHPAKLSLAKLSSAKRRAGILGAIESHGRVEVSELSSRFGVAEETIRRDLKSLENAGKLRRAHGGAIPAGFAMPQVMPRTLAAVPGTNVARFALRFVPAKGTIFLGPGAISETLATILPDTAGLQVLTNSIPVALKASRHTHIAVYNLGGTVDPSDGTQTGQWTREEALSLRLDVSFFAPRGLSTDGFLTAPNPQLASLLKIIINASDRTVVLADQDSLGNRGLIKVAALHSLDDIIVDPAAAAPLESLLQDENIRIHIAHDPVAGTP